MLHKGQPASSDVEAWPGFQATALLRIQLDVADSPLSQEHLDATVRKALERGLVRRRQLESVTYSSQSRRHLDRGPVAFKEGTIL